MVNIGRTLINCARQKGARTMRKHAHKDTFNCYRFVTILIAALFLISTTARASTWVSGSNTINQPGVYRIVLPCPCPPLTPGSRTESVSWIDSSGDLWLFGGNGYDKNGTLGCLNDLWRFDGTNWRWVSGSDVREQPGVYRDIGVPHSANVPGARYLSVSWIDSNDDLWLFGGLGFDKNGTKGLLNDLWKFDGTYWTWISGLNITDQPGVYGSKGVPYWANMPGARGNSISWIDSSGNLWLFGGGGYDFEGGGGFLNDLWRFDGVNWTWMSGANVIDEIGIYGTKGIPDPSNKPGARYGSVCWIDAGDNLWLFGGYGMAGLVFESYLNDLWRFDGDNWTWMSGFYGTDEHSIYGNKGVPNPGNTPGARHGSISWIDASGDFFLFGGYYAIYVEEELHMVLNDLWRFDGTTWTWISGSYLTNQSGVYGIKGVPDPGNFPGGRYGSISWIDGNDELWLFGGSNSMIYDGRLNDLWKLNFCDYAIPGDVNGDCVFNFIDFSMMAPHWLEEAWHH